MKFCFHTGPTDSLETAMGGLNVAELLRYLGDQRAGTKMHLIVRPRPEYDFAAMNRWFHGPLLDWVVGWHKKQGIPAYREQWKAKFKVLFIGPTPDGKVPSLSTSLNVQTEEDPRTPREKWIAFTAEINTFCIREFGEAPPDADERDLGEERNTWPLPEKTTT